MFYKRNASGYQSPTKGVEQKTLVYGEKTLMVEFKIQKNSEVPRHRHPHEQTGYLIKGKIRLFIDSKAYECEPGDSWCIPGDAEHGADIIEDSIAIEIFSPVREDYLPKAQ